MGAIKKVANIASVMDIFSVKTLKWLARWFKSLFTSPSVKETENEWNNRQW
jgi:hypothetical protein